MVETAAALDRAANSDSLTQLPNRRATMVVLDRAMNQFRAEGMPLALALVDIDRFKSINDTYGHADGDRVLREFAARLRKHVSEDAHVGRWGGEEFLIVLTRVAARDAMRILQDLRSHIAAQTFNISQGDIVVTASIGLSAIHGGETSGLVSVLARADQALYLAKSNGRNRVEAV
ncbi:MAG: GGDEF domain-containing protein [Ahniella sp.]|nr:GGDEF domain-containing protein [Ahniella sp.]